MSIQRNVIVHYHLFKNAGSSIDHLLKFNFDDKWMAYDSDSANGIIPCEGLEKLIAENPEINAFSSHQIIPPLPKIDGNVYPIVVLRDPIDRVKSAYLFEQQKQLGLDKPKGTLEEYIKSKFRNRRHNSIEEFQVIRLSNKYENRFQNHDTIDSDELLENAKKFIESLSFIGIVDDFDRSVELLIDFVKPAFPDFKAREFKANVLQDLSLSQQEKRQQIESELSAEVFEELLDRNRLDESLYQLGKAHFEKLWAQKTDKSDPKAA